MRCSMDLGANWNGDIVHFKVWAPRFNQLSVIVNDQQTIPMNRGEEGYFTAAVSSLKPNDTYYYSSQPTHKRPDPVSRFLPNGLMGPTSLENYNNFVWEDHSWKGILQKDAIFYECHVGTYTKEGTFEALISQIPYLMDLGITHLEIMPVAQTPGRWNWGYDGASLYAVNSNYGGPFGLKKLVNACHLAGIAVVLDVVYNHLGPEGNFLSEFGYYMSNSYNTPWGKALNFDGPYSNEVRKFIIDNALYWIHEYHIDALRLDAIHGIYDFNALTVLELLSKEVKDKTKHLERSIHLFVENDRNDAKILRSFDSNGSNFDGAWNDDFHHAVHVELTKETIFYYEDFKGFEDIAIALEKGYVYQNRYSTFRKRNHGNFAEDLPLEKFITFIQNHDQIGNRVKGDRLHHLTSFENVKLAAALNLLSPSLPLLFMGEEWGEESPFLYFVDYEDQKLMKSVVEGRKREFGSTTVVYTGEEAFLKSKLKGAHTKQQIQLLNFYKDLIQIRKGRLIHKESLIIESSKDDQWISLNYEMDKVLILFIFGDQEREIKIPSTSSFLFVNSEDDKYGGKGTIVWNQADSLIKAYHSATLILL